MNSNPGSSLIVDEDLIITGKTNIDNNLIITSDNSGKNFIIKNGDIQVGRSLIAAEGGLNTDAQLRLEDKDGIRLQSTTAGKTATVEVKSDVIELTSEQVQFSSPVRGTNKRWNTDGTPAPTVTDPYVSILDPVFISAEDVGLVVAGKIRAQDIDVTPNESVVPDYVFLPDYELKSIDEVETYIKANGHLPEVPSAKEIGEKGYKVTSMDFTLLKKVEELTLYLIEANKKIEELSAEVKSLKEQRN